MGFPSLRDTFLLYSKYLKNELSPTILGNAKKKLPFHLNKSKSCSTTASTYRVPVRILIAVKRALVHGIVLIDLV